jgi:hypothetical protein
VAPPAANGFQPFLAHRVTLSTYNQSCEISSCSVEGFGLGRCLKIVCFRRKAWLSLTVCFKLALPRLHLINAIRKVKRDDDSIINKRLADSIISNSTLDFWSEIRRICSNRSGTSRTVDGQTESITIAKLFADKFQ